MKDIDEFLEELVNSARRHGWDGDYVEIRGFVQECFLDHGREPPTDEELEPFGDDEL